MTKDEALSEIKIAEAEVKRCYDATSDWWQKWHGGAAAKYKAAEASIYREYKLRYEKKHAAAQKRHAEAERQLSALRCRHADILCGYPIDSVMGEWTQSWSDWKPTGRTGVLEVYRIDTEWPDNERPKPSVGTVIIRVTGKNGKPTKQAQRLSREPRDCRLLKYVWLPVGQRPKE